MQKTENLFITKDHPSHLDKNIKTTTILIRASFAIRQVCSLHFLQAKPVKQLQNHKSKLEFEEKRNIRI